MNDLNAYIYIKLNFCYFTLWRTFIHSVCTSLLSWFTCYIKDWLHLEKHDDTVYRIDTCFTGQRALCSKGKLRLATKFMHATIYAITLIFQLTTFSAKFRSQFMITISKLHQDCNMYTRRKVYLQLQHQCYMANSYTSGSWAVYFSQSNVFFVGTHHSRHLLLLAVNVVMIW